MRRGWHTVHIAVGAVMCPVAPSITAPVAAVYTAVAVYMVADTLVAIVLGSAPALAHDPAPLAVSPHLAT